MSVRVVAAAVVWWLAAMVVGDGLEPHIGMWAVVPAWAVLLFGWFACAVYRKQISNPGEGEDDGSTDA